MDAAENILFLEALQALMGRFDLQECVIVARKKDALPVATSLSTDLKAGVTPELELLFDVNRTLLSGLYGGRKQNHNMGVLFGRQTPSQKS